MLKFQLRSAIEFREWKSLNFAWFAIHKLLGNRIPRNYVCVWLSSVRCCLNGFVQIKQYFLERPC